MLTNIELVEKLNKIALEKSRPYMTKKVKRAALAEAEAHGWTVDKEYKNDIQVKKQKPYGIGIQDRIWSVLYKMDFLYMSGKGSAELLPDVKTPLQENVEIDVVGIDQEVGVGIFVKASPERREADGQFRQDLELYVAARSPFATNVRQIYRPLERSRIKPAFAIFACNIDINEADKKFAKEKSIAILDENDLKYYEDLIEHLGAGAKYQFLADILDDMDIPALNIMVPAIRIKTKKITYYTFAIQPEYLLKISYMAHRARGEKADLQAYQRMAEKSRLLKMKDYIDKPGIFPTNIVISLKKKPIFEESKNLVAEGQCGEMGVLKLRNAYKSAWIIDGQHRLYAYSGHARANSSLLSVIAFEDLSLDMQAEFFIDINSKQKNVKQSELQQLFSKVHKDATDPADRLNALISEAIEVLNNKEDSVFHERIKKTEDKKSVKRCLSWNTMFSSISEGTLTNPEYGILWVKESDEATKVRITYIVNEWFLAIKKEVPDWWDAGSMKGSGGLSINDSVAACFHVLKSVLQHLVPQKQPSNILSNQELRELLQPYAAIVSRYLASLSREGRLAFRAGRGVQGQTQKARMLQIAINKEIPDFLPPTLKEYIQERDSGKTRALLIEINNILRSFIVEKLQNYHGIEDWWMDGISVSTQQRVQEEIKKDKEKRGVREQYLDFGDYTSIFQRNWDTFKDFLEYRNVAEYAESSVVWLQKIIDIQEIVSQNKQITPEQLDDLDRRYEWLRKRITLN